MTGIVATMEPQRSNGEGLASELARRVSPATLVRRNEPLAKRTTLRVGGPAEIYVEPASEADLAEVVKFCAAHDVNFFVLGRGSNLLVRDGGIRGVVLCLSQPAFSGIEIAGEHLRAGAGAKLKQLAVAAKHAGLSGLEFLEGIPGSVGGALRMNAGAMGRASFDALDSLRVMLQTGAARDLAAASVAVEYRQCPLLKNHLALGAVFRGRPATSQEIEHRMKAYSQKRWASQPATPSAGCCFKNPPLVPAGQLIDSLGLKGARVGDAMVSPQHANFIVNVGSASARDVLELIALVQSRVLAARGFALQTEIEIVGVDQSP